MKFVVRFSYARVAKGRVFSATEYTTCRTFTILRTTDFAATHRKLLNVYFAAPQRRSLWRVEKRNATVFGTMARFQAMGEVVAVKRIMKNGIGTRHEP